MEGENVMQIRTVLALLGVLLLLISPFLSGTRAATRAKETEAMKKAQIQRGAYLVNIGGCNDCHSPKIFTPNGPQPDPAKLLSGYPGAEKLPEIPTGVIGPNKWGGLTTNDSTAWVGPWGVSFSANLTPDVETGLGGWTVEMFIKTMQTGKHLGAGRQILPPMPWWNLAKLSNDDLRAMFAYLRTLKPIQNVVPPPIPPANEKPKG
jgi:mono/diheme cytochrome c family protein